MTTATAHLSPAAAAEQFPEFGNADWFRDALRSGRLRGSRINGRWYTTAEDIAEMVAEATNRPARRRRRRAS